VYHLLPMCSVYIEFRIKSQASECLLSYFLKLLFNVSNEPQTCSQQHILNALDITQIVLRV
jgi:hypothetical protein